VWRLLSGERHDEPVKVRTPVQGMSNSGRVVRGWASPINLGLSSIREVGFGAVWILVVTGPLIDMDWAERIARGVSSVYGKWGGRRKGSGHGLLPADLVTVMVLLMDCLV
jgi:hypothetical protein